MSLNVNGILETCLYATDLEAAEQFYVTVLGLELVSRVEGRHVFFRCGSAMFLVFDPEQTRLDAPVGHGTSVPAHGADGAGHAAFSVPQNEMPAWRDHLNHLGIDIEAEVHWPRGGYSLYVRDPAGNSIELASPGIWDLSE